MIKIGALWSNTDSKGNKYLSGKFGDARVCVFKNNYKKEDKQPDFQIYVVEEKKRAQDSPPQSILDANPVSFQDDEIPF